MRAVVQRSGYSLVKVDSVQRAEISRGLVVLLGIKRGDTLDDGEYLMDKIIGLRIFEDEEGKMNCSLRDIGGEILLISQFTLYGDARKGRRPSFTAAESPEAARPLFEHCQAYLRNQGIHVATGVFGADMLVHIENDGPCTILLDSERAF